MKAYRIKSGDYLYVLAPPNHPFKNRFGRIREHRAVIEKSIGRFLKPDEHVHHVNGDKHDNRLENLQLMTHGEHSGFHSHARLKGKWSIKFEACIECRTTSMKHYSNGRCALCYERKRFKKRREYNRVKCKEYYYKNRKQRLAYNKKTYPMRREAVISYHKEYYRKHKKLILQKSKIYKAAHKEWYRAYKRKYNRKYRAKQKSLLN